MIVSEAIVKEVNQYYARKEGRRTANIPSFANFMKKAASSGKAAPKTVDKAASDTGAQNTAKSDEASPAQTGTYQPADGTDDVPQSVQPEWTGILSHGFRRSERLPEHDESSGLQYRTFLKRFCPNNYPSAPQQSGLRYRNRSD